MERAGAIDDGTGIEALPASRDLVRLLDYWQEKRGSREFPRRADLDPIDLKFMLERIALTEVHENPRRCRLRLVGGWWFRMLGFEATGMWLEEFPHTNKRRITEEFYQALIDGRRPRLTRRDAVVDEQRLDYEIMLLPLSEDGDTVSMIVTGIGPFELPL